MSSIIKVTNPETVAALGYLLEKLSGRTSDILALARDTLPWQEYDAVEEYLTSAEKYLVGIIADIIEP